MITSLALLALLAGQDPPVIEMRSAEVFAEPFSLVVGAVELSDSRVIVADGRENALYELRFADGSRRQIGRNGQGPREYRSPSLILLAPGDTVLMTDFGNLRVAVVAPDGEITRTIPARIGEPTFPRLPEGVDAAGRWYIDAGAVGGFGGGQQSRPAGAMVLRWTPDSDAVDTIATLERARGGRRAAWRIGERWVALPDGSVAIVRRNPYRVDIASDRGIREGSPVAYDPIPVTRADQEAWADAQASQSMTINSSEGSRTVRRPRPNLDEIEFPEFFPPYSAAPILVTPNGMEIWVPRQLSPHADSALYDVFDSTGQRIRQARFGGSRRLVGMGNGVAYAIHVDEDGLQWLERYEL